MKYKNRLVIPTLVSTSLLASTIVVNAEEMEQNEQSSQQNIEEYSTADYTSEIDLDFIETDTEEIDEESPEDSDEEDESLEDNGEENASDEIEEDDEKENGAEVTEESEEQAEEQEADIEDVDNTVEEETAIEAEQADDNLEKQEVPLEVVNETLDDNILKEAADTEEIQNSEDDSEAEITEEPVYQEDIELEAAVEESNQVQEGAEVIPEVESETSEKSNEEATYDSELQELETRSEEVQPASLEENTYDIEAKEELLNEEIPEENDAEHIENEIQAATASTFSTMSTSQSITDINEYIAVNDFDVAEIQYDIIEHLPLYAFNSNYGREPENGKVGQPSGVVLHDVGNDNSTIHGEISYMSENWGNAFVHAFVDADNIIQVANTDYLAYGAGPVSNEMHLHVELVRHDNQHDFARSINNYADYIANLLYKYKLPAERADSNTGEGTLWSHVEVSHILGGTASPDPYEYFQSHGYAYNDVIELISSRYNNLYDKVTTPSIYMPTFEGETEVLQAEITGQNRGIYESITDVRTYDASALSGLDLRVVRSEIYNYEKYYLLENANDGTTIGWMYAGDVMTSSLEVEPEAPIETPEPEAPVETPKPEAPIETPEPEAPIETPEPEEPVETPEPEAPVETPEPEAPIETPEPEAPNEGNNDNPEEDNSDDQNSEDGSGNIPSENDGTDNQETDTNLDPNTDDNNQDTDTDFNDDDSAGTSEGPTDENTEADAEAGRQESTDSDDTDENDSSDESANTDEDREVSSSLVDAATGVRVYSASDELNGKSLAVTVLGSSDAIGAPHDLFDIHVLNADGSLYNLNNAVTVYLPANGYVSNVYYLGNIGETLEAVNYRTEDGYVVFEAPSFSQYAVVYGSPDEDNTTVPPISNDKNTGSVEKSEDRSNEHPTVYTEDVADEAAAVSNSKNAPADAESTKTEVLPNTGIPEQSTTIFAAVLAALGLGFLVKRRKTTDK